MAENPSFQLDKLILPLGLVLLGGFAITRIFPRKQAAATRLIQTETGEVIEVAAEDPRTFGGRLGEGLGANIGEFVGGVPGGAIAGVGRGLKRTLGDPLGDLLGFDEPGIFKGLGFRKDVPVVSFGPTPGQVSQSTRAALEAAQSQTARQQPLTFIRDASGTVVGVEDPNTGVSRLPTAAELRGGTSATVAQKGEGAAFLQAVRSGAVSPIQLQVEIEKQRSAQLAQEGRVEVRRVAGESEDSRRARVKEAQKSAVDAAFERIRTGRLLGRTPTTRRR